METRTNRQGSLLKVTIMSITTDLSAIITILPILQVYCIHTLHSILKRYSKHSNKHQLRRTLPPQNHETQITRAFVIRVPKKERTNTSTKTLKTLKHQFKGPIAKKRQMPKLRLGTGCGRVSSACVFLGCGEFGNFSNYSVVQIAQLLVLDFSMQLYTAWEIVHTYVNIYSSIPTQDLSVYYILPK